MIEEASVTSVDTQEELFVRMLENIVQGFLDVNGIHAAYEELYPDRPLDDQEICGVGVRLEDLVLANVRGFAVEVLSKPESQHFMLASSCAKVTSYLRCFDVAPYGPDLLKYTVAFGLSLSDYVARSAERPIVKAIVRLQIVRLLRNGAAFLRDDSVPPPAVMVRKIAKIWKDEREPKLLGGYGSYMVFKTWSLG